jgi:hypothetical protein
MTTTRRMTRCLGAVLPLMVSGCAISWDGAPMGTATVTWLLSQIGGWLLNAVWGS